MLMQSTYCISKLKFPTVVFGHFVTPSLKFGNLSLSKEPSPKVLVGTSVSRKPLDTFGTFCVKCNNGLDAKGPICICEVTGVCCTAPCRAFVEIVVGSGRRTQPSSRINATLSGTSIEKLSPALAVVFRVIDTILASSALPCHVP